MTTKSFGDFNEIWVASVRGNQTQDAYVFDSERDAMDYAKKACSRQSDIAVYKAERIALVLQPEPVVRIIPEPQAT